MKKARNILLALLCALLLIAGSVAGTLAYLTSLTGTVTNTFTVGNVTITMDEGKVNEYGDSVRADGSVIEGGVQESAPRVQGNEYKLIPGHHYSKDPMIYVDANSEECWLFVKIENGIEDIEAADDTVENTYTIKTQLEENGWTLVAGETNVYGYQAKVPGGAGGVRVFTHFVIDGEADVALYDDAEITVIAYAVQGDGFDTADEAWAAAPSSWVTP